MSSERASNVGFFEKRFKLKEHNTDVKQKLWLVLQLL